MTAVVSPDFGNVGSMVTARVSRAEAADIRVAPKVVVADSGSWRSEQMQQVAADGTPV